MLVDQEGGRVQRLGPPHWPAYPAGAAFGRLYARDRALGLRAARLGGAPHRRRPGRASASPSIACRWPMCRSPAPTAVIGDRAYGDTPARSSAIAGAVAEGLAGGGVLPVVKHLPGHGRATADSHQRLPVVDTDRATLEATDFAAFKPLGRTAAGHDRPCRIHSHRSGASGHHLGRYHSAR